MSTLTPHERARQLTSRAQLLMRMSAELAAECEALAAELGAEVAEASADEAARELAPSAAEELHGELASADEITRLRAAIIAYCQGATVTAGEVMLNAARAHGAKNVSGLDGATVRALTERYAHALAIWELCEEVIERSAARYISALIWRAGAQHIWDVPVDTWRVCACTLADWDYGTRAKHVAGRIARVVDAQGVQP